MMTNKDQTDRKDLKEIICRVIDKVNTEDEAPVAGCLFGDTCDSCDVTTRYAIGEEG